MEVKVFIPSHLLRQAQFQKYESVTVQVSEEDTFSKLRDEVLRLVGIQSVHKWFYHLVIRVWASSMLEEDAAGFYVSPRADFMDSEPWEHDYVTETLGTMHICSEVRIILQDDGNAPRISEPITSGRSKSKDRSLSQLSEMTVVEESSSPPSSPRLHAPSTSSPELHPERSTSTSVHSPPPLSSSPTTRKRAEKMQPAWCQSPRIMGTEYPLDAMSESMNVEDVVMRSTMSSAIMAMTVHAKFVPSWCPNATDIPWADTFITLTPNRIYFSKCTFNTRLLSHVELDRETVRQMSVDKRHFVLIIPSLSSTYDPQNFTGKCVGGRDDRLCIKLESREAMEGLLACIHDGKRIVESPPSFTSELESYERSVWSEVHASHSIMAADAVTSTYANYRVRQDNAYLQRVGLSFHGFISNATMRHEFEKFLEGEHSSENYVYWTHTQHFGRLLEMAKTAPTHRHSQIWLRRADAQGRRIYREFVESNGRNFEVLSPAKIRSLITEKMQRICLSRSTFEELEKMALSELVLSKYIEFSKLPVYWALLLSIPYQREVHKTTMTPDILLPGFAFTHRTEVVDDDGFSGDMCPPPISTTDPSTAPTQALDPKSPSSASTPTQPARRSLFASTFGRLVKRRAEDAWNEHSQRGGNAHTEPEDDGAPTDIESSSVIEIEVTFTRGESCGIILDADCVVIQSTKPQEGVITKSSNSTEEGQRVSLQPGYRVTSVNGQEVTSLAELMRVWKTVRTEAKTVFEYVPKILFLEKSQDLGVTLDGFLNVTHVESDSQAWRAGIREGWRVSRFNQSPIVSDAQLAQKTQACDGAYRLSFTLPYRTISLLHSELERVLSVDAFHSRVNEHQEMMCDVPVNTFLAFKKGWRICAIEGVCFTGAEGILKRVCELAKEGDYLVSACESEGKAGLNPVALPDEWWECDAWELDTFNLLDNPSSTTPHHSSTQGQAGGAYTQSFLAPSERECVRERYASRLALSVKSHTPSHTIKSPSTSPQATSGEAVGGGGVVKVHPSVSGCQLWGFEVVCHSYLDIWNSHQTPGTADQPSQGDMDNILAGLRSAQFTRRFCVVIRSEGGLHMLGSNPDSDEVVFCLPLKDVLKLEPTPSTLYSFDAVCAGGVTWRLMPDGADDQPRRTFSTFYSIFAHSLVQSTPSSTATAAATTSAPAGLEARSRVTYLICEGFLSKKGALNTAQKKRWFQLWNSDISGHVLRYYKHNTRELKGEIHGVTSVKAEAGVSFSVQVPNRNFVLNAETPEEKEAWVTSLTPLTQQENTQGRQSKGLFGRFRRPSMRKASVSAPSLK